MRNSGKNQSPGVAVPAKQSDRAVAPPTYLAKIKSELTDLNRVLRRGNEQELAERRRDLAPLWKAADRPATANEIATQVMLLTSAFPNTARADLDLFAQIVADDVATLKPTTYELAEAFRAVRAEQEFLSVKAVIDAIKKARTRGRRARYLATGAFDRNGPKGVKNEADYHQLLEITSEGPASHLWARVAGAELTGGRRR